ncbi:MAG: hypothetical protein IT425_02975 [Pirellulales bacterium]|nr:hypothetical protein [Pirellulales bacterium]
MTQSWYDMIMSDVGLPEGCVLGETSYDLCGVEIEDMLSGKPVTAWNCQSTMMTKSLSGSGFLTDVMYLGRPMIPVFSSRLQQALSAAKVAIEDIQYLPIKVVQSTGITTSGFAGCHWLCQCVCSRRLASKCGPTRSNTIPLAASVQRGLVKQAIEWRWSSASWYLLEPPGQQQPGLPFTHGLPAGTLDRS